MTKSKKRPSPIGQLLGAMGTLLGLLLAGSTAFAAPRPAALAEGRTGTGAAELPIRGQDFDAELEELLVEARSQADTDRRRGRFRAAELELNELLDEEPEDWRTRAYLARLQRDRSEHGAAASNARRAREEGLAELRETRPGSQAQERRDLVLAIETELLVAAELAQQDGVQELADIVAELSPNAGAEPRLELALARWRLQLGQRELAEVLLSSAAGAEPQDAWDALATARARRARGDLTPASYALAKGIELAGQREPELLAELASIYFEADGEVADERTAARNPGPLYKAAIELNAADEGALLGLFELYRFNWRRQSVSAWDYLDELFAARPASVDALLAAATAELEVGRLPDVRKRLARLEGLAPERREVRSLKAALGWVEHRRGDALALLEALAAEDPLDSAPDRTVGEVLVELYRFSEAVGFLESAVERAPGDYRAWASLGRARANTGDVAGAREALRRGEREGEGRRNAFAENLATVLEAIDEEFVELTVGDLTFAWNPTGAETLAEYMVPFYSAARADLARRYGYTSGPVRIEVFDRHRDFSVRSTGFEGFPALGVCFGPVVTAVSPLSDLRGSFSWARTAYHEFTHVVHLGLSNNRCPRWITEGLATWEEVAQNPAWTRNMREDLLNARANGDVIPLRDLNEAFRGPRILFGYYQGGLLCEMLIDAYGFPSMIRLLEAFDRGDDLDEAFRNVFDLSPEEADVMFAIRVDELLSGIELEPLWRPERIAALRFELGRTPPEDAAERRAWRAGWATVAHGSFQRGNRVDSEEALRLASRDTGGDSGDVEPRRLSLLRGQMAVQAGDGPAAIGHFNRFLDLGGEDFRARLILAGDAADNNNEEDVERHLMAAEQAFPGYPTAELAAEMVLASFYLERGDEDRSNAALERWLNYNADQLEHQLTVARWHAGNDRPSEAAVRFQLANDIELFRRDLHRGWGRALRAAGEPSQALREFRVTLGVPPSLDSRNRDELSGTPLAELHTWIGELELELGRPEAAREAAGLALEAKRGFRDAERLLKRIDEQ